MSSISSKKLAINIYKIGLIHPIEIDENRQIIDGKKRLEAVMMLRHGFYHWESWFRIRYYKKYVQLRTRECAPLNSSAY